FPLEDLSNNPQIEIDNQSQYPHENFLLRIYQNNFKIETDKRSQISL
ncbi:11104_t:CDS:1, partial [Scutellospora calospora]